MPDEPKAKKWGESSVVAEIGIDLKSQLQALSDASDTSISDLVREAVAAFLRDKKGIREAAVRRLAEKLGVDLTTMKPIQEKK